ncbi:MAG TPA: hypothetical protein VGC30_09265 [Dokdonella sp.]
MSDSDVGVLSSICASDSAPSTTFAPRACAAPAGLLPRTSVATVPERRASRTSSRKLAAGALPGEPASPIVRVRSPAPLLPIDSVEPDVPPRTAVPSMLAAMSTCGAPTPPGRALATIDRLGAASRCPGAADVLPQPCPPSPRRAPSAEFFEADHCADSPTRMTPPGTPLAMPSAPSMRDYVEAAQATSTD